MIKLITQIKAKFKKLFGYKLDKSDLHITKSIIDSLDNYKKLEIIIDKPIIIESVNSIEDNNNILGDCLPKKLQYPDKSKQLNIRRKKDRKINKVRLSEKGINQIKGAIQANGMKYSDISKQLGKSQSYLSSLLNGHTKSIKEDDLIKLLNIVFRTDVQSKRIIYKYVA